MNIHLRTPNDLKLRGRIDKIVPHSSLPPETARCLTNLIRTVNFSEL